MAERVRSQRPLIPAMEAQLRSHVRSSSRWRPHWRACADLRANVGTANCANWRRLQGDRERHPPPIACRGPRACDRTGRGRREAGRAGPARSRTTVDQNRNDDRNVRKQAIAAAGGVNTYTATIRWTPRSEQRLRQGPVQPRARMGVRRRRGGAGEPEPAHRSGAVVRPGRRRPGGGVRRFALVVPHAVLRRLRAPRGLRRRFLCRRGGRRAREARRREDGDDARDAASRASPGAAPRPTRPPSPTSTTARTRPASLPTA